MNKHRISIPAFAIIFVLALPSCGQQPDTAVYKDKAPETSVQYPPVIDTAGKTIAERFNPPPGYARTPVDSVSFGAYLRRLPLKPHGALVKYHHGGYKTRNNVYIAVVDMKIGKRDLEQCADAVMRLRAEYLYKNKRYSEIHFNFLGDGKPRYYKNYAGSDYSYARFLKYMNYIFAYANTASLHDELKPVENFQEIQAGDVFIQKGNPYGHAAIIVDVAENTAKSKKMFLLAQSYMPAQETQILENPNNPETSPWYATDFTGSLYTPEWTFEKGDLRRFR